MFQLNNHKYYYKLVMNNQCLLIVIHAKLSGPNVLSSRKKMSLIDYPDARIKKFLHLLVQWIFFIKAILDNFINNKMSGQ